MVDRRSGFDEPTPGNRTIIRNREGASVRRAIAGIVIIVGVTAVVVGFAPQAYAAGGGPANPVVVHDVVDGAQMTRARTQVQEVDGPTAAPQNMASAYASCTDCRTVATAVQVIIVVGAPQDVEPANAAVAVNDQCVRCETFAYANQVLVPADHEVALSASTQATIAEIRQRIADATSSPEPFDQMSAELDGLVQQLVAAVQADVNAAAVSAPQRHRVERTAA